MILYNNLYDNAIKLLKNLIKTPSFSKEEDKTADIIESYLRDKYIIFKRYKNNIWAFNKYYDEHKPNILLSSHHDTVMASSKYTINPFDPIEKYNKIFGLGSNDAGGSLVSLLAVFTYYYNYDNLKYNILFAATAEEEISGNNGIKILYKKFFPKIYFAFIGEPTNMQMNIGENGLLVLDIYFYGKSSHVAMSKNGENAIINAFNNLSWMINYKFTKKSIILGSVKMNITQINGGIQHNIIPDTCKMVVDIRVNELYSNKEIVNIISNKIHNGKVIPRSTNLNAKIISKDHPIVRIGLDLGLSTCVSSTISDRLLISNDALKIGPGDSSRSHIADEYIYKHEIKDAIDIYINIMNKLFI